MTNHELATMREYGRRQTVRDGWEGLSQQSCERRGRYSDCHSDWEREEWGRGHRRMSDFAMMCSNRI